MLKESITPNKSTQPKKADEQDKKLFKVAKVKDTKPPTSLAPNSETKSQAVKKKNPKIEKSKANKPKGELKKKAITRTSIADEKKQNDTMPDVETVVADVKTATPEVPKAVEVENVEDDTEYNINFLPRAETPKSEQDQIEIVKPKKNLPNAPPPGSDQASNQLNQEEIDALKDLEMSVSVIFIH